MADGDRAIACLFYYHAPCPAVNFPVAAAQIPVGATHTVAPQGCVVERANVRVIGGVLLALRDTRFVPVFRNLAHRVDLAVSPWRQIGVLHARTGLFLRAFPSWHGGCFSPIARDGGQLFTVHQVLRKERHHAQL